MAKVASLQAAEAGFVIEMPGEAMVVSTTGANSTMSNPPPAGPAARLATGQTAAASCDRRQLIAGASGSRARAASISDSENSMSSSPPA